MGNIHCKPTSTTGKRGLLIGQLIEELIFDLSVRDEVHLPSRPVLRRQVHGRCTGSTERAQVIGKPQENHRKTIGKMVIYRENQRKTIENW
jgi:hypothetical protein